MPEPDGNGAGKESLTERNTTRIDRRTCLKLAGSVAAVPIIGSASGTETTSTSGYGVDGYGVGGYGEAGTDDTSNTPPVVDSLIASESSPPNPHAEVTVDWTVSDPDGNLENVDVDVREDGRSIESETVSVSGNSAGGSSSFKIKHGANGTFDVFVSVSDSDGADSSKSDTVAA